MRNQRACGQGRWRIDVPATRLPAFSRDPEVVALTSHLSHHDALQLLLEADPAIPDDLIQQYTTICSDVPSVIPVVPETPFYVYNPGEYPEFLASAVPIRIRRPT
eukprot:2038906-Pyramimonas_sp.AAC.1